MNVFSSAGLLVIYGLLPIRHIALLAGLCTAVLSSCILATNASAQSKGDLSAESRPAIRADLSEAVRLLQSRDFKERQAALASLKNLTASQISELAGIAEGHDSADVAARILELLEQYYLSESKDILRATSAALESLTESDRQLIAESARASLERNWMIRVELAAEDLQKYGAILKRDDQVNRNAQLDAPLGAQWRPWQSGVKNSLKIILTEKWTGGQEGIDVFNRMKPLLGKQTMSHSGLSVFLIDGHTLTDEQLSVLRNLLGDGRVAPRGKVVLGITGYPQGIAGSRPGCIVDEVEPFGSADSAGLEKGDLIVAIEDKPIEDFLALVESLKAFKVGDTMKVTVKKGYQSAMYNRMWNAGGEHKVPENTTIEIKLKGWEEFANPIPRQESRGSQADDSPQESFRP